MNIAARIVEILSGMSYEDFLQRRFFDPLGMTETTFWPTEAQVARLAGAYGPHKEKNGFTRSGIGLSVNPTNGMVAILMVQCPGPDQWAARDLFLRTATEVFEKARR